MVLFTINKFLTKTIIMKTTFNKLTFALLLLLHLSCLCFSNLGTYKPIQVLGSEVTMGYCDNSGVSTFQVGYSSGTYLDSVDFLIQDVMTEMFDSWGDGWNGAYVEIIDPATGTVYT